MNGSFSQSPAAFQIPNCCHQGTQLGAVKGIVLECLVDPSGYRLVVIAAIAFQKIKLEVYSFQVLGLSSVNDDSW